MNNLTLGVLISLAQWMTPAPIYSYGAATWYAPGVMEATCQYRADEAGVSYQEWMDEAIGGVALMSPADLGKTVWVRGPLGWEGPFRVCDCGTRGQVYEMVMDRGEVVELGWHTASSWGMGPHDGGWKMQVEVWIGDFPKYHGQKPVDYVSWFDRLVQ